MSGQEDNRSQIEFFSNEYSIENMQNAYTWKFPFYIKVNSKRDVSLIWLILGVD